MTRRVALVKSAGRADAFAEAVRALGRVPVLVSPFREEKVAGWDRRLAEALAARPDWVAVTSPHGALALSGRFADVLRGTTARVAAVGPGTASALHSAGVRPTVIGSGGGTALGRRMTAQGLSEGDVVLHVCGEAVRPELAVAVDEVGGRLVTVHVYRMVRDEVGERAAVGEFCALVIGSPRLAHRAAELFPDPPPAVAIGRTTAAAMRDMGWSVSAVAATPTPEDLTGALRCVLERDRS